MAIDGKLRKSLAAGMSLVASYKKQEYRAEVVTGEDGKIRFRLADGREFTSPSAAGSAVMGGIACNGWRFWSFASEQAPNVDATREPRDTPAGRARKGKPKRTGATAAPAGGAQEPATD